MGLFDYIRAIRNRMIMIITGVCVFVAISIFIALTLPKKYEAEATIMVEESIIPADQVSPYPNPQALESVLSTYKRLVNSQDIMRDAVRKFELNKKPYEMSWQSFRENVVSVESVRGSRLIAVGVQMQNPELAQKLANYIANTALEKAKKISTVSIKSSRDALQGKLKSAELKLQKAEAELLQFREESGLLTSKESTSNRLYGLLTNRYRTLLNEWRYLTYCKSLVSVLMVNISIPGLSFDTGQFEKGVNAVLGRLKNESVQMHKQLAEKRMQLHQLERTREIEEKAYKRLAEKYNEVSVQIASRTPGLKLVDPALVPQKPSSPKRKLIVLGTAFISTFFFLFLAAFMEFYEMEKERHNDGKTV